MDPIKAQKVRAGNLYKKSDLFFQSLILHSLLALACSLFCSSSYSFPNCFYTIKHLFFNSLPNTWSWFVSPSCLFVVVNFIVVFLIGESRTSGGKQSSSPGDQVYDEYVARIRSLRRRPSTTFQEVKKEEKIVQAMDGPKEGNASEIEDRKEVDDQLLRKEESDYQDEDFIECEENVIGNENDEEEEQVEDEDEDEEMEEEHEQEEEKEMEEENEQEEEKEEDEEEAVGIAAEELNRKVEDFIARVNKQRWLEARFLVCSTRD